LTNSNQAVTAAQIYKMLGDFEKTNEIAKWANDNLKEF
jgi:hypothetical protein